jgi:hypothetical protein
MSDHNLHIGDFVVDQESRVGIVVGFETDQLGRTECAYELLRSGNRWWAWVQVLRRLDSFDKFELAWTVRQPVKRITRAVPTLREIVDGDDL